MRLGLQKTIFFFTMMATLTLSAQVASAQDDPTPKTLHSPARVRGFVGGEAHKSYQIRARKGQRLTVQIAWNKEGDNQAEFTVSESSNFREATPVEFGKSSTDGKRWSGVVPKTQNYYIFVVARPQAHYTLRVTIKPGKVG
jgi:hypothetical protein